MAYVDFFTKLHSGTKRDYLERVLKYDKAECGTIAKRYGEDNMEWHHKNRISDEEIQSLLAALETN